LAKYICSNLSGKLFCSERVIIWGGGGLSRDFGAIILEPDVEIVDFDFTLV